VQVNHETYPVTQLYLLTWPHPEREQEGSTQ